MAGCKPDAAVKQPAIVGRGTANPGSPPAGEPQTATADVPAAPSSGAPTQPPGSIVGTIFFKGKAPTGTIDTSMDPACGFGPRKGKLPVEQFVVKNGALANVFLYVKSGPPEAMRMGPAPAASVVLDQKDCQYVPHVVGVMAGGYVEFRNSDPTMHNIHTTPTDIGNETVDISEGPRGQPVTKQFRKPELMIPVRCNNHPWMNAFINVSATPFFAVSDADGKFSLTGLPPGDYTIGAVHEKMGEKTMQVTVKSGGTAKAEFSFAQ
jgi:plastocyanin